MNTLPKAKSKNIVVQPAGAELLIYDLDQHRAYCLNETAAIVWSNCDGRSDFEDIRSKHGNHLSDEVINLALGRLSDQKLLDDRNLSFPTLSRRAMIATYGTMAAALPVVVALVAPRSIAAQSLVRQECPSATIPWPAGCTFGTASDNCDTCKQVLASQASLFCSSGILFIDSTCTPDPEPPFVDCTAVCL